MKKLFCHTLIVNGEEYMKIINCEGILENYGACTLNGEYLSGTAEVCDDGDISFIKADVRCVFTPYEYARIFEKDNSLEITVETEEAEKVLAQQLKTPFWTQPCFSDGFYGMPGKLQYVLIKHNSFYEFILPVANENFFATVKGDGRCSYKICVSTLSPDNTEICGTVAVVSKASEPYEAIKKGYTAAVKCGIIKTPLKSDKKYPEILKYLGWCTWNAFYHDVSEEKILAKAKEFKEKNIPVKWILIDDGWSETDDLYLKSIYEDKNKFPNGLKHTIDILKETYGIKKVGVWHSATGYWKGIGNNFESIETCSDIRLPVGYEFYSKWYGYLKEQGVDFIKVDSQGNLIEFLRNSKNSLEKVFALHDAIERSAEENFDFVINCMGMCNINMFAHKSSVMLRNSDDFYPKKTDSLKSHVMQNVYNAVFNDNLFFCDYDMWWSEHFQAEQNAVLRYISGGPFYLSDEEGRSNADIIRRFVNDDGQIDICDNAAKPLPECLFGFKDVLKIYNTRKNSILVAMFTFENAAQAEIKPEDFGKRGVFTVNDVIKGDTFTLKDGESLKYKLNSYDVRLLEFIQKEQEAVL